MSTPPDDGLTPVPPPDDAGSPQTGHDAEETAPAFNPLNPESSWMAFLAPPALDIDEASAGRADAAPQPAAGAERQFDPEATVGALDDPTASLSEEDAAGSAETASADSGALAEYDPVMPGQSEAVVAGDASPIPAAEPSQGGAEPVDRAEAESATPAERPFDELTIAEMLGRLRREPGRTFDALLAVLQAEPAGRPLAAARAPKRRPVLSAVGAGGTASVPVAIPVSAPEPPAARPASAPTPTRDAGEEDRAASERGLLRIILLIAAFGLAVIGTAIMQLTPIRSEAEALFPGLPWLIAALIVALIAEAIGGALRPDQRLDAELRPEGDGAARPALRALGGRLTTGLLGAAASILALILNGGNTFTGVGVIAWLASVLFWVWTFAPQGWTPAASLRTIGEGLVALGRVRLGNPTFIALIVIMALGAYLRLVDLDRVPGEMTSDHVEFILDVSRVLGGQTSVFFANIGGREPLQFYLLAALSSVPGLGLTFLTQKLLTAIEGVLVLPLLWWLGREFIGPRQPRLGNLVGLIMAALTAVSYWALILSRLGERIALTPIAVALILIFFIRALRYGRRWDFILTGVMLGFGLYAYQAVRMLPVILVGGVALAVLAHLRSARARGSLLENLGITALIAFVIFVPLFGYSLEHPEEFWRRTSGRLFGDEVTQTTNEAGEIIYRTPSVQERLEAFAANLPTLTSNLRNAVLMYNWKGDVGWFQNYPNTPAFDVLTGGLLVVGVGAWIGRMLRRRDPIDWMVMLAFWVLLLPSALALAYPIENPSFTRLSGTLPIVFLWAAYPLAQLLALPPIRLTRIGTVFGLGIAAALVLFSASVTNERYFTLYHRTYLERSLPHSAAGELLADFASSGAGFGNAFIIAYPNWWDHRAVGLEAGRIDWPNTVTQIDALPLIIQQAAQRPFDSPYRLNVNADLLFFVNLADTAALTRLQSWFPSGYAQEVTPYQIEDRFWTFRVPALGEDGFNAFLERAGITGP